MVHGNTSVAGRRICELAQEAARAPDAEEALRTLMVLRHELDDYERQQAAWALTQGGSYADVARALGISRQAAHRRFKDLAPPRRRRDRRRLPVTAEVRLVLGYARAEALALRAATLQPEHLLIGILRNGDRRAAAALAAAGITLEDARLEARRAASRPDREGPRAVDAVLGRAARRASEERATQLGLDHLLRGLVAEMSRAPHVPAARVIAALDGRAAEAPTPSEAPAAGVTSRRSPRRSPAPT
jgi:hypothetical protein